MHSEDNPAEEPLLNRGFIIAVGSAVLALVIALGVPVSDELKAALVGVVAVAAPLIVAAWGRQKVYSPATVQALMSTRRPDGTP